MNRQETIKLLAILKAAWPNSYKGMTKEEANGTVLVWATQFSSFPANVVMFAVQKLISVNTFPPTVGEVKERIRSLYIEAEEMLRCHKLALEDPDTKIYGEPLDGQTLETVQEIIRVCQPMRTQRVLEPSLSDLIKSMQIRLAEPEQAPQKKMIQ